jgi:hypothetical protein
MLLIIVVVTHNNGRGGDSPIVPQDALLVTLVKLVDRLPMPPAPRKEGVGIPKCTMFALNFRYNEVSRKVITCSEMEVTTV